MGVRVAFLIFQIAIATAMVVAAAADGAPPDRYTLIVVTAVGAFVVGLPVLFAPPSYGWFHPLVFAALYGTIGQVRSFATYAYGLTVHGALPAATPEELNGLLVFGRLLALVATVSLFAGYFLCPVPRAPVVLSAERPALQRRLVLVVGATAAVFVLFLVLRGGVVAHFASWSRGRALALSGAYYWVVAVRAAGVAMLVWLAYRPRAYHNPMFWIAAAVSSVMAFAMTGSRSSVVFFIAIGLIIWMLQKREVPLSRTALALVGVVVLVGMLGGLRDEVRRGGIEARGKVDMTFAANWERSIKETQQRSGAIRGDIAIYGNVPRNVDFLHGRSYLSLLTLPVPRGLWPGKPYVIEAMVGRTFFRMQAGVPPGGVAEAYWNFHVPGIVLVYFIFGGFLRWLAIFYVRNRAVPVVVFFYAFTLFNLSPSGTSIIGWAFGLVPFVVVALWIGRFRLVLPRLRTQIYSSVRFNRA